MSQSDEVKMILIVTEQFINLKPSRCSVLSAASIIPCEISSPQIFFAPQRITFKSRSNILVSIFCFEKGKKCKLSPALQGADLSGKGHIQLPKKFSLLLLPERGYLFIIEIHMLGSALGCSSPELCDNGLLRCNR